MKSAKKEKYMLQSVKNASRILRLFSQEQPELGVTQISKLLGLNKSTVYHLMSFLTADGLLEKKPNSRYRLGLELLRYTGIITTQMEIHRIAVPILESVVELLGESALIGILEGREVAYLQKVEVQKPGLLLSMIGDRNPASCTGTGKVLLAFQKASFITEIVDLLQPYGPNAITDAEQFKRHLKEVRGRGYAICIDEFHEGVASIGVPVRDYTGGVIAALSVVGPTERIRNSDIPQAVAILMSAARDISNQLGHYA